MNIPQGKKQHFVAGFGITVIASLFVGYLIAAVIAILAAAGKELYDKVTGKGTPELLDFVATVIGTIAAIATSVAATWMLKALVAAII